MEDSIEALPPMRDEDEKTPREVCCDENKTFKVDDKAG